MASTMNGRVQLNVRIPKELREKVQRDSDRNARKITRDVVVAAILEDFFDSWTLTQRNNFYLKHIAAEDK